MIRQSPEPEGLLSRRAVLRGAAGGAALMATHGLPAWARPVASAAALRRPDSRPFPHQPLGAASMPEISHVVVLIMENHSFDNLLGMVPYQVVPRRPGGSGVDRHRDPRDASRARARELRDHPRPQT